MKTIKNTLKVTSTVARTPFRFSAAKAQANPSELVLDMYGDVGESFWGDGITAAQVSDALKGDFTSITVRLNSPGGDAFEGMAIYNRLREQSAVHNRPVTVYVDGIAASAASVIAMAGDKVIMGEGTLMMIHNAWIVAVGNSQEMRQTAALLEKLDGSTAELYGSRTGKTKEEVLAMMLDETWMSADEAIAAGFADEKTGTGDPAEVAAAFDLSVFAKTPAALVAVKPIEEPKFNAALLRKRFMEDLVTV